ncbi:hypothetical protein M3690_02485 [Priestia megaterium]|uniref:hypothetical protein n=1 Tax=Priestia megaterium TaxID=1404 RepID=UPI002040A3DB|nr:hypothetical protein [Priestia megaterium]MCM3792152.1 hypothetical protein [Priestia megaterium]
MQSLYYLFIINIFFLFFSIKKEKYLFNLNTFFNAYALMYFSYGIFLMKPQLEVLPYGETLIYMAIISIVSFNLIYYLSRKRIITPLFSTHENHISNNTGIIILVIGILAELLLIVNVGPFEFFTLDRYERFPILKKYDYLMYFVNLINISLAIFLNNYLKNKDKQSKRLLLFCTLHSILYFIVMISRNDLLLTFIIFAYFLERYGKVRKVQLIVSGSILAFIMFFYKSFMYSVLLGQSEVYFNYGELVNWIRNTIVIMNSGITADQLPNNSYILTLKSFFVISPKEDALSEWFVKTFYPESAVDGFTMGFSGLIEGYLYSGLAGVMIHYSMIGLIFGNLEKRQTVLFNLIRLFLLFTLYKLFRSEIYNFVKGSYWYYVLPIIGIYYFDILLKGIARKQN